MSKKDKLIARLRTQPKDFTFDEADSLLNYLGFERNNKGKTSGSRISFINSESGLKVSLHRPHPQKELKAYQIEQLLEFLNREGLI